MVTAVGSECYINVLPAEMEINTEDIMSEEARSDEPINSDQVNTTYVTRSLHEAKIISDEVDNPEYELTDTMKEECKGKLILYSNIVELNSQEYFDEFSGVFNSTGARVLKKREVVTKIDDKMICPQLNVKYQNL